MTNNELPHQYSGDHTHGSSFPIRLVHAIAVCLVILWSPLGLADDPDASDQWKTAEEKRTNVYAQQLESFLLDRLIDQYPQRSSESWNRDYSSVDAFLRSVEPNRQRWREFVKPPQLRKSGDLQRRPAEHFSTELKAEWLTLPLGKLSAEAVLVLPPGATADKPVPIVIAMHGIGSTPEKTFDLTSRGYHGYGKKLVDAGFAVLAPMNLRSVERRNHVERLCRLDGITLPGIEFVRLQNLLDVVLADPRIDSSRVGMWGVSLGGMATMFWMPLEPRIKAGVVSAWFNHRLTKMAVDRKEYTSFIVTNEEHAFFNGWLTEFADHDVTSLILPRPVLVQHGKQDRIGNWPDIIKEFDIAKQHYAKLGLADRVELNVHDGGHEAIVETGVTFLLRWLK